MLLVNYLKRNLIIPKIQYHFLGKMLFVTKRFKMVKPKCRRVFEPHAAPPPGHMADAHFHPYFVIFLLSFS